MSRYRIQLTASLLAAVWTLIRVPLKVRLGNSVAILGIVCVSYVTGRSSM